MLISLVLFGCSDPPVAPQPAPPVAPTAGAEERLENGRLKGKTYRLAFDNLEVTEDHLMATEPSAVKGALVGYERVDLDFHTVYKRGDKGFGDRTSISGKPLEEACNNQDYNALFEARDSLWLASHFECTPGEIFLTRLKSDDQGLLTPEFNRAVDFSRHGGLWNPCAGMITPWGSLLSSEEYEPNAARVPVSVEEDSWDYLSYSSMKEHYLEGGELNPYQYGWTPEVGVLTVDGDTITAKHKSMGRFSHEIALVMPDEKTVYLSDDGTGGGLFMFVADQPRVLSAGKLYAARFNQTSAEKGGAGEIVWIPLGEADDKWIDHLIASEIKFDEIFDMKPAGPGLTCPGEHIGIRADGREECLKLQEKTERVNNVNAAASRLETRRYAAYLGATTEWEKGEGIAMDPERKLLYVAFARIGGRMVEEDGGSSDHIRLPANPCGAIWSGPLGKDKLDLLGKRIPSEWVLSNLSSLAAGRPVEKDALGNTCALNGIANPDNIAFLPYYRVLMVAEDTSRHSVAALWALDVQRASLKRVMVAPPRAEITGITWSPNLQGHGYLSVAIQHPWRGETLEAKALPPGITEDHQRSITGYLGPFPPLH